MSEPELSRAPKRRIKWEPAALMLLTVLLGILLVSKNAPTVDPERLEPGSHTLQFRMGTHRGTLEVFRDAGGTRFRVHDRFQHTSAWMDEQQFEAMFGPAAYQSVTVGDNFLFQLFNITNWGSMIWIAIGLGGQVVFSCRFIVQWIVSERRRESVIPDVFWWISLLGAVCLFAYFVWRKDIVGVLGQSTGVVIYARNLRLIHKKRRREAKRSEQVADKDR